MIKAIYKITNLLNGKIYIGQSVHPSKRWVEHKSRANTLYDNCPIHLAIHKYGEKNFDFQILEWTEDYDRREQELIAQYNSLVPNGYNLALGGNSLTLIGELHPRNTLTNETVRNIILALKQNKLSDREIAKQFNTTDKIVADINHGYSHKQLNENYPIRCKRGRQKLTETQVNEIKELLLSSTLSFTEIGQLYGTSKTNISQINCGRSFKRDNTEYPIRKKPSRVN